MFCLQMVHKMIEAGASVKAVDANGRGVLHCVAQGGSM